MAPVPILAGHRESMLLVTHVDARSPVQYAKLPAGGGDIAGWSLREASAPQPASPRLLDRVRQALRARHMSRRTEEAYVAWIRRYIFFCSSSIERCSASSSHGSTAWSAQNLHTGCPSC